MSIDSIGDVIDGVHTGFMSTRSIRRHKRSLQCNVVRRKGLLITSGILPLLYLLTDSSREYDIYKDACNKHICLLHCPSLLIFKIELPKPCFSSRSAQSFRTRVLRFNSILQDLLCSFYTYTRSNLCLRRPSTSIA